VNHDEALSLLEAGNLRQRLQAARVLREDPRPSDRLVLQRAARTESVPRIQRIIEDALTSIAQPSDVGEENDSGLAARDTAARAVRETTRTVVHEVRNLLPSLRLAAEQDIADFAVSHTREYIDRLDSLVDAIDRLGTAASAPVITDFDLAQLVDEVVSSEAGAGAVPVEQHGSSPFLVLGDRGHIMLAVSNGLRNALEATLEAEPVNPSPIVVTWDSTDSDYWVVVLDRGVGLPPGSHRAFEFGRTSKQKHDGAGLAIAKQAIDTLGGEIQLRPRQGGGASYEVSWPRASSGET
jgi:signal transduction histidine kinase